VSCDSADGMPLHHSPPGTARAQVHSPPAQRNVRYTQRQTLPTRFCRNGNSGLYADLSECRYAVRASAAKMTADNMLNMVDATATRSTTIAACPGSASVVRP